ncbi:hypothetical protein NQ317_015324 [Molorchus minor]|uniref:Laccase 2 n=1 Tax=Molorchus minor TaxID=1323400 RepID=A0ABQ9J6B9_9CUCU|nr:hypothetical protein NQ317_015324 [Molorchus minor]
MIMKIPPVDQSTSASWWQEDTVNSALPDTSDFFSSAHGILQTHPGAGAFPGKKTTLGSSGKFKHLDYRTSATAELRKNPLLSSPDQCARACREGEPPKICYYHFTLEFYTVLGAACQVCTPNATNALWSNCQCVLADGVERGILTANRMLPGPSIQVCEGDKVVIDVENHLEGMEVTLHWHGVWQRGTQYYDGVPFVTQCPIQQGNTFRVWAQGILNRSLKIGNIMITAKNDLTHIPKFDGTNFQIWKFSVSILLKAEKLLSVVEGRDKEPLDKNKNEKLGMKKTAVFKYQWMAGNAGTHFWHAHTGLQKMDGLYGSIVVRQPPARDPNSDLYDYDLTTHVMLLSDWMHEDAAERYPGRLAVNTGQDPESLLINGKGQFRDPNTGFMTNTPLEVFTMTPGKRYRFRVINSFASVCPAQLTIEGHDLILIATDGEPVHPVTVNTIISFSGERYDFVINADRNPGAYWMQLRGLGECGINRGTTTGHIKICQGSLSASIDPTQLRLRTSSGRGMWWRTKVLNPLDARCNEVRPDAICVSQLKNAQNIDRGILNPRPDVKIFLPFRFHVYTPEDLFAPNTYNRHLVAPNGDHVISLIDEISYLSPPSPPLSQYDDINPEQFCNGDNRPANCGQNCMCTHKVDIPKDAIVEVVLVDEVQQPNLSHPFHLHGYAFNVIGIGRSPDQNVKKINLKHALDLDRQGLLHRQFNLPPGKDTIAVPNNGYVVLRFRADNPGFWLFHCHFLFHIAIGMNLIFQVGSLSDLPPVPEGFPRAETTGLLLRQKLEMIFIIRL